MYRRDEAASTTRLLRVMNERAVFERIRELGPVSRPQLAAATGLSKPTISLVLANLERRRLVRAVGRHRGNAGGRAARLYEMRPDASSVLAIDVGRTWVRAAVADLAGDVLARRSEPAQSRSAQALVSQISRLGHELADEAGVPWKRIGCTVVGSPGVVDRRSEMIRLAPNLAGWSEPGVLPALRQQVGGEVIVENDVKLATLGEQAHGQGRGVDNFVLLSVGTGIGMGIVVDGRLYRGWRGAAGEIGFLPLADGDGSTARSGRGELESLAGAEGVVALAGKGRSSRFKNAKEVFDAARRGDAAALEAVAIEAERLARALASVTALLDPERVVLGGGVGQSGDLLIAPIQERLRALLRVPPPELVVSALGDDAVVLGGLATALIAAREAVVFSRVVSA